MSPSAIKSTIRLELISTIQGVTKKDYRELSFGTAREVTLLKMWVKAEACKVWISSFLWQSWQKQISVRGGRAVAFLGALWSPWSKLERNLFTLPSAPTGSIPSSELEGPNHHIHLFLSRAGVSLGPGAAAPVAVGGVVPEPADQHLALEVHRRVPAHELEGVKLEPSKVAGRGVVGGIGRVSRTPGKEQKKGISLHGCAHERSCKIEIQMIRFTVMNSCEIQIKSALCHSQVLGKQWDKNVTFRA